MPSASTKSEKAGSQEPVDPLKQAMVMVDKKIRNLEKRKTKLDCYKSMSASGKQLNEDQKTAVNKYEEVIQQLELAKELTKQLNSISADHQKAIKKQQRKEILERQQQNIQRIKHMLIIQNILRAIMSEDVRYDLLNGCDGAPELSMTVLHQLDKLCNLLSITDVNHEEDVAVKDEKLALAADHFNNLLESKNKELVGTTYKELKDLFMMLNSTSYFNKSIAEAKPEAVVEKLSEDESTSEKHLASDMPEEMDTDENEVSQQPSVTVQNTDSSYIAGGNEVIPGNLTTDHSNGNVAGVISGAKATESYAAAKGKLNFLQDSQIEINSPHVDPAIVAAHPMVPPSHSTNYIVNSQNAAQSTQESRTMTPVCQTNPDYNQSIPSQTFTNQNYVNMPISQTLPEKPHANVAAQIPQQMPAYIPQMTTFQTLQAVSASPPAVDTTPNPPPPIPLPPRSQPSDPSKAFQMNSGFKQTTYSNQGSSYNDTMSSNFGVQSQSSNPSSTSPTSFNLQSSQTGSGDGFPSNSNVRDPLSAPQSFVNNQANYASRVSGTKPEMGGSFRNAQPSFPDPSHCDGDKTSQNDDEWQSDIPTSTFVSSATQKNNFHSGRSRGRGRSTMSNGTGGRGVSKGGSYHNGRNYGGYFKDKGDKDSYGKDNFGGTFHSGALRRGAPGSRDGYRGNRGSGRAGGFRGGQQPRN